ncbi:MAG: patatin-like phospholipase family protein [Prevotellaceae bacterium]|jgi:NTE family protein|nr:patatin-like phospholipase family protein [Prevotellaceae bacterium]
MNNIYSEHIHPSELGDTQYVHRIGLSLSGGGVKGIAHLGVIQAMEERGWAPNIISGVSAGAIAGALYADGHTPKEICRFLRESGYFHYVSLGITTGKGLMSNHRFASLLESFMKARTFEELKMPVIINATELVEGVNVYFHTGTLIDKIIASSSVPVVLTPAEINGKMYVDGGIFCNMPAQIIRPLCRTLIGVHVNPIINQGRISNIKDIAERVYHLTIQANTVAEKQVCDLVVEPVKARNYGMFEKSKGQEIFDIGYQAAVETFDKARLF